MRQWLLLLFAVLPFCVSAQAPDNEKIDLAIHDASSPYFYPSLMNRYLQGDPALEKEDYRHLYYGYMFQLEYNPYASIPEGDSIVMILLKDPDLVLDDYKRLIYYSNRVLDLDPFSPRVLNILTYAYGMIGDAENEAKMARRFEGVVDAILSTGEGSKESSPWHILFFTHAQDIMDLFGLQYRRPMVISRTVEYFPLLKREGRTRGYYFDYGRIYTRRPDDEDQDRFKDRKWQLNDRVMN